jgi:hypothetical protein
VPAWHDVAAAVAAPFFARRQHLPYAQQQQALHPYFAAPRLGFLAIIAFPHYYAASLGELGSRQWAQWGTRLAALGIPVRCCFLDCLSYTRGLQGATTVN